MIHLYPKYLKMKVTAISLATLIIVGCSTSQIPKDSFIDVQGVYTLPTLNRLRKAGSDPIRSIWSFDHFSYMPNSGINFKEAIVIRSWNHRSGALAEGVLLSVLFGATAQSSEREYRVESQSGKLFHIYTIEISNNDLRDIYFDATQYHELY